MKRYGVPLLVAVILLIGFCAVALADLTSEETKQAQALIAQFSDRRFAVRQEAVDKLVAMGLDVLPLVKKTLAETDDNEVKLRCEMAIRGLQAGRRLVEKRVRSLGKASASIRSRNVISPHGEHLGTVRNDGDKWWFVCDGKDGLLANNVVRIVFSDDDRRLAYTIIRDGKWHAVVDGKVGPAYDRIRFPLFSPDGRRVVYAAKRGPRWVLVADGRESGEYDEIKSEVFARAGGRFACVVRREGRLRVLCDGKEGTAYDRVTPPVFSPDGTHLTYGAKGAGRWFVVTDGVEGQGYRNVLDMCYSPDGTRLAFAAESTAMFSRRRRMSLICNGKRSRRYALVWGPFFSGDGKHLACLVRSDRRMQMQLVRDDVAGRPYDEIRFPVFSPDGTHVAYWAQRQKRWMIVCDTEAGPLYTEPDRRAPVFSPDSRHLAWRVRGNASDTIVVDGIPSPEHDLALLPEMPTDVPGKLRYVTVDDGHAWLVEVDWPTDLDWTHGLEILQKEEWQP